MEMANKSKFELMFVPAKWFREKIGFDFIYQQFKNHKSNVLKE